MIVNQEIPRNTEIAPTQTKNNKTLAPRSFIIAARFSPNT